MRLTLFLCQIKHVFFFNWLGSEFNRVRLRKKIPLANLHRSLSSFIREKHFLAVLLVPELASAVSVSHQHVDICVVGVLLVDSENGTASRKVRVLENVLFGLLVHAVQNHLVENQSYLRVQEGACHAQRTGKHEVLVQMD